MLSNGCSTAVPDVENIETAAETHQVCSGHDVGPCFCVLLAAAGLAAMAVDCCGAQLHLKRVLYDATPLTTCVSACHMKYAMWL
jgi:hypothetical protein